MAGKGNGGSTATKKSTRTRAKSAATRRRILEATAAVLLERGYAGTRLGDIAERADLQAGSLYYYFDSKEMLVEEVLRYGVQFSNAHVRAAIEALPAEASPGERLEVALSAHLEALLELGDLGPAHSRTYSQIPPQMQDRLRTTRRAFGKLYEELVGDAIAAGEIRGDVDPYVLRLFIFGGLEQVPAWNLNPARSAQELLEMLRRVIFEGIGVGGHFKARR